MLLALVLLAVFHPGRLMPGKQSDFPSRKERKAMGKGNVHGRVGGALPLYERSGEGMVAEPNPTYPKIDATSMSYGYASDAQ